jgi:transketolase
MDEEKIEFLKSKALEIRRLIIEMIYNAGSGHPAGSLGMADIFSALYFHILKHNPKNPNWEERDRLILSNGHICPVLYASLALSGYFPVEELKTLRKINSRLQGHPYRLSLPGIENTSGSLGEGLGYAIGVALSAKLDNKNFYVYCITSDGEHNEGSIWEAYLFLNKYKIDNLIVIIDRNKIQQDGNTEDVMPLEPFREKLEAFGMNVLEVDGHNIKDFINTVEYAKTIKGKTNVIICHTTPGKGVSFIENNYKWHGKPLNKEEYEKALEELRTLGGKIINEHQ